MNQILFSIIIPLYNKSKWINDTINCVLNQTEKNFEIIYKPSTLYLHLYIIIKA